MKNLPAALRPREKLLSQGPAALADAELLALLLGTGASGLPVLQMAQTLLERGGGLQGLLAVAPGEMPLVRGLGPAKRGQVAAVLELARRSLVGQLQQRTVLTSVTQVKAFVQLQLAARPHEVFAVMFLDAQHQLLQWEEMFRGSIAHTSVYPREVVKRALSLNAGAVILVHNHPSGLAEPSPADRHLTRQLQNALALVDVRVLDHLVVGHGAVVSFGERGLM
ncbi:MAG: DNA repair protein RadC [Pseudomonadota bacterium]